MALVTQCVRGLQQLPKEKPFFKEGENCWRISSIRRLGVLVDAENYYSAFLSAIEQARHHVIIIAWDIDTRINLAPGRATHPDDVVLGRVLERVLTQNPDLNFYILCWDFAMIYTLERQVFPHFRRSFRHPRVHFALDGRHPFGASHHQKIVSIDDRLAFVGGLDLCSRRWDSREHLPSDHRRLDLAGKPYHPFHDIQVVLDGKAALDLSLIARDRWTRATGKTIAGAGVLFDADTRATLWPETVIPDFDQVQVAISRTDWSIKSREIEKLYLDSIGCAQRYVYIESQYFTSERIINAIAKRLQEPNGPEFLILMPRYNSGWIEQSTMGVLRLKLLDGLRRSDQYGRLRFYYPKAQMGRKSVPISLHSKIMIVDESILHTGSSNLSNRSMGLDTECDIAISAEQNPLLEKMIGKIRNSLLAEHLGANVEEVMELVNRTGSIFNVVDVFGKNSEATRLLVEFSLTLSTRLRTLLPDSSLIDPDRPIEENPFIGGFLPKDKRHFFKTRHEKLKSRLGSGLIFAVVFTIFQLKFMFDPLEFITRLREVAYEFSPLYGSVGVFILGSILLIPADLLVFLICLMSDPWSSWFYAMLSICFTEMAFYLAGSAMGMTTKPRLVDASKGGNYWEHFLLHLCLFAPVSKIAYRAGTIRAPVLRFISAVFVGNMFRVIAVSSYAITFEAFLRVQSLGSFLVFLMAIAVVMIVFRWSTERFFPTFR